MKTTLTPLCLIVCISQLFSQSTLPSSYTLLDFEEASPTDSTLVFGNYRLNGMHYMVSSNPQKDHLNKSNKVITYTKSHNATLDAGFSMQIPEMYLKPQPMQVCFDYYAPTIGTCRFQVKNRSGGVNATMVTRNKKINEWETICATIVLSGPKDLSSANPRDQVNHSFVLFPDDRNWGTGEDQNFYFDNLILNVGNFSKAIKFSVNMNGYEHECAHVFVSGSFNSWSGDKDTLYDDDKDGIWELDLRLFEEEIEYVFSVDGWKDLESFSGTETCIVSHPDGQGGYYRNRKMRVDRNMDLEEVCFGSCYECGASARLTWNLNMNSEVVSDDGLFLAGGDHFGHGIYKMEDEGRNGMYTITLERQLGFSSHYTFTNGLCPVGWGCKEDLVGQHCADENHYSDRFLPSVTGDMTMDACFGYCSSKGLCETEAMYEVTFNLDARALDLSESIYLSGNTINGWSASRTKLNDEDGDGIYTVTLSLPQGEHLYKFVYGNQWEDLSDALGCTITDPSGVYVNRYVIVEESDLVLDAVLFGQCNGFVATQDAVQDDYFVNVYPSVTYDYLQLSFYDLQESCSLVIYDANGRLYDEQSIDGMKDQFIDVSNYNNGAYFIAINNGSSYTTRKFFKI